ncbi:transcriptional regulator, TetR family [Frankineae bacterium MT45]|nr:transcriptional regulator, TetR family [Frankineae bacterium MT45]
MSPGGDPLFDTLFRSTAPTPGPAVDDGQGAGVADEIARPPQPIDSAAPTRAGGTRSRAGNSMSRTRLALLEGARSAVIASGTRVSMAQVAAASGVAKATLYNHFRTRDAVLAALMDHELGSLVNQAADLSLAAALRDCAASISSNPLRSALAASEGETLATLARVPSADDGGAATPVGSTTANGDVSAGRQRWATARAAIDAKLTENRSGDSIQQLPRQRELILRWLVSHLISPARETQIDFDVTALLLGCGISVEPSRTLDQPAAASGQPS